VEEDAVVFGSLLALAPSLRAPLEFDDEVVVAVVFLRGDVAVAATADVEGAVLGEGPDVLRIIVEVGLWIDVVFYVAGFDDFEEVDLLSSPAGPMQPLGWTGGMPGVCA
jgi:hypothetical protein